MSLHDSIFSSVFEALQRRMGIPHVTDPTASQRVRVVWEATGAPKPERVRYHRHLEQTLGRLSWPHTATVYGSSQTEVQQLVAQLWAHVDAVLGPAAGDHEVGVPGDADYVPSSPGYEFAPGKLAGVLGGDGKAAGYACDVAVVLRQIVPASYYPASAPVESVELEVSVTASDGTSPETAAAVAIGP